MIFGKNLRFLRRASGLSQQELATMLGCRSHTTVQKWERDQATPPVKRIQAISVIFNVTMDELLFTDLCATGCKARIANADESISDHTADRSTTELHHAN